MGTQFRIVFYAAAETDASTIAKAGFERIRALDECMSDYSDTSELTRLCRDSNGKATPVSEDLFRVLARSQWMAKNTRGAFDATCGPAVRLWRRARRLHQLPGEDHIERALERVGFHHLELDEAAQTATLTHPKMQLDLGGIAKGYACDEALAALKRHGVDCAMIDGGGGLALGAPPPNMTGWTIQLATPATDGSAAKSIVLNDCGIATSGDAAQYIALDGVRYSHIVDPRTGLGLTNRCQATVIAPTGMDADALATAVCVLGPEEGIALLNHIPGTAGRIIFPAGEGFEVRCSQDWDSLTRAGCED